MNYSKEHAAYLRAIRTHGWTVGLCRVLVLVLLLGFWELGARLGWFDVFILSSPSRVLSAIGRLWGEGSLLIHVGVTLYETIMGFLLGTGLGILLAVLLWWLPFVNEVMDPYLVVLNALPKIALGPVLIVWIGAGMGSIIVMAVLISLVVTTVTVLSGFTAAAAEKQFLMRTLGAKNGVIVGEYLVSKSGLGYLIVYGGQVFKLDLVMASVVILCVLAALMYGAVALLEKRFRK